MRARLPALGVTALFQTRSNRSSSDYPTFAHRKLRCIFLYKSGFFGWAVEYSCGSCHYQGITAPRRQAVRLLHSGSDKQSYQPITRDFPFSV
jgi:hypothetical protein